MWANKNFVIYSSQVGDKSSELIFDLCQLNIKKKNENELDTLLLTTIDTFSNVFKVYENGSTSYVNDSDNGSNSYGPDVDKDLMSNLASV